MNWRDLDTPPFAGVLRSKVALCIGATSGIGLQSAIAMARAGAQAIIVNGRSAERGRSAEALIRQAAPETILRFGQADMGRPGDLERMFEKLREEFDGIDIVTHCGMGQGGSMQPFTELDPSGYRPVTEGMYFSLLETCRLAVPMMRARGGGSIVCISSDAARVPTPGESVIGGAFAAGIMFAKTLAMELGRDRIRVNTVTPSLVRETLSHDAILATEFGGKIFRKIEQRARLGLPAADDVAMLVTFLASPLSAYITGQVISINGGVSIA